MKPLRSVVSLFLVFGLVFESAGSLATAETTDPAQVAADRIDVPPLTTSGTPKGEEVKSEPLPKDVLTEPPSDGLPVEESWTERLDREKAAAPTAEVVGFDEKLSVEDESGRTAFGSTYDNVDGTKTSVIANQPVNFLSNGKWQPIDPRVIPTREGTWVTKANDHVLTFSSKSIELVTDGQRVHWVPAGVSLSEPIVSDDGLTVTYQQVWPGVDLRYRLESDRVTEEIVILNAASVPADGSFVFEVSGPALKTVDDGTVVFEGPLGDSVSIGGTEVFNSDGFPISDAEHVSLTLGERVFEGDSVSDVLSVGIDPKWATQLPDDAFPIVVDPMFVFNTPTNRTATNNVGTICPTNPVCDTARVGNAYTTVNRYWRTAVMFDYSAYLPTSTVASQLTSAALYMEYVSGVTSYQPIAVRHAQSYNYCAPHVGGNCAAGYMNIVAPVQSIATGSVNFDVSSLVNSFWYQGGPMPAFALTSSENAGQNTYKRITTRLTLTYNRLPVPLQGNMSPGNPYTFHNFMDGMSLSINQLTDPDGDPLYYRFLMCTSGCTTIAEDSGWDSVGSPDADPWTWTSGLYAPGIGLTAWFYNQQLSWQVMVSNSPTGAGFISYSPWNSWKMVNSCPAAPTMSDPAGAGTSGFIWAPNNPPTLTITPNGDPDGDTVRYRFVVREKGATGLSYASAWTTLTTSTAPINFIVPADVSLQPGVSYEWSAEFQDNPTYWHWYAFQGNPCAASSFRTAEFEARLGSGGPSPMQTLGPVTVNLATGNLTTSIVTPQVSTLGGAMGASLSYNSRANDIGLRARLYNDANGNMLPDPVGEIQATRVDREMSFTWASPGAVPGITNFVGTWTGYVTVPSAGTYYVAAALGSDERVKVEIGAGYTLQVNYASPAAIPINEPQGLTATNYNSKPNVSATAGGLVTTSAFQVLPITVTYRNPSGAGHLALYLTSGTSVFGGLPTTWLSPDVRVVPRGWTFNHLDGAGASYTSARVEATEIVLTRADGSTVSYARNSTGGYTPPAGENDVVSFADQKVTVIDVGGAVHRFNVDGMLEYVTAPADTKTPAAPIPGWTSVTLPGSSVATSRMTALTNPISTYQVTFQYQSVSGFTCPTGGSFAAPPAGMLCQITYPDSSTTKLRYVSDGQGSVQLSRVENPGDATLGYPTLDLGYALVPMPAPSGGTYTVPLLASVRDPLVNDAIAAGLITDDPVNPVYVTAVAYDTAGRVLSVTAPKPSSSGFRQKVFVDYQITGGVTVNETRTRILGLSSSSTDWDSKVEFDSMARTTREYQALNSPVTQSVLSEYGWDGSFLGDRLLWSKSAKQYSSSFYSPEGWVTDSYGPANESCFNTITRLPNGTCTNPAVPHASTIHDGGLNGLSVIVWPNNSFSGPPSNMATGIGGGTSLSYNWGGGSPAEATDANGAPLTENFSMRLTGSIVFPQTGTYTFSSNSPDDVLNVFIDDQLVFAGVYGVNSTGTFYLPPGSSLTRRIRLDYVEFTGGAAFTLNWSGPGISGTVAVPTSSLKPRYGLVTSTTVDDSGGVTPSSTSTISYAATGLDPVYGLATSVTSGGLTTTTGYETGSYRRRISRTLPAGNQTTYEYYANAATADNPCTVPTETTHQGGMMRYSVDPVAQTGKQIVSERVYDNLSRVVASRRGTRTGAIPAMESTWSCITYDARQRPTTVTVPNNAGTAIERTVTTDYFVLLPVATDPRKVSVTDPAGTITSESDLLGRSVSYTDVWGTVTASAYDATGEPGRLGQTTVTPSTSVVAATHAWDFDRAGRLTRQYLDGNTIAIPTYNTPGSVNEHSLASVSYPSGAGNAGNDTSLAGITRNTNGAVTSTTWNQGAAAFFTNTVTRSQTGRVVTDSVNGGNTSSFEYDTAGRLLKATQPGHVLEYQFGTTACGGTNPLNSAGANSNRTALVDNSVTIATYCYDNADRLVSTSAAGYGGSIGYDDHGNTTTLAGETLGYDGADRHMTTTANGVTVSYTRDASDRIVARTVPAPDATPVYRVAGPSADNGNGSTALTLERPLSAMTGDLLLATIATAGSTVSAPSGWTTVATTSSTGVAATMFWRLAAGSDPTFWTFSLSASQKGVGQIVVYDGIHETHPIDIAATAASAFGTNHPAATLATTEENRLILTVAAVAVDTTWTPQAGATERVDVAGTTGAPSVALNLSEHGQVSEGQTLLQAPVSASPAVGATITVALRPANSATFAKTLRYSYSGVSDATTLTLTASNVLVGRTCVLPGGVALTDMAGAFAWSYPNIHGDVTYVIDSTGGASGPYLYDPFGQALAGLSNTGPGELDNGWLGQHQRPSENQPDLRPTIEMGARPYRADLGRFLRVDPVDGGAGASNYAYVHDPVNDFDITGKYGKGGRTGCLRSCKLDRRIKRSCAVCGMGTAINGTFDFVSSVAKRIDVSFTVCLIQCAGIGFQGGTVYTQSGNGCCFIGPSYGLSTREYPDRACQSVEVTGRLGVGGSVIMGNYDASRLDLPSADVEIAYSPGIGFGVAGLQNHDILGPRSCP